MKKASSYSIYAVMRIEVIQHGRNQENYHIYKAYDSNGSATQTGVRICWVLSNVWQTACCRCKAQPRKESSESQYLLETEAT